MRIGSSEKVRKYCSFVIFMLIERYATYITRDLFRFPALYATHAVFVRELYKQLLCGKVNVMPPRRPRKELDSRRLQNSLRANGLSLVSVPKLVECLLLWINSCKQNKQWFCVTYFPIGSPRRNRTRLSYHMESWRTRYNILHDNRLPPSAYS